jgi:thiol:disulfide interchange protein/DsbC/DsbD-like thiol-disulfide interchange protein
MNLGRMVGILGAALGLGAMAAMAAPQRVGHVTVELVAEEVAVSPGRPLRVGLAIHHDEHWHTYWKNPGDSGLATSLDWELPDGWKAGPIEWPVPERIQLGPLVSYAYEGRVLLVTAIQPPATIAGGKITFKVLARWLMCQEECIPGSANLQITLPVRPGPVEKSAAGPLFLEADQRMPARETPWEARASEKDGKIILDLTWPGGPAPLVEEAYFFAAQEGMVEPSALQSFVRTERGYRATLVRPASADPLAEIAGILTGRPGWAGPGGAQAWEMELALDGPVAAAPAGTPPEAPAELAPADSWEDRLLQAAGWPGAMLLAFGGGLILNLMPCVLPVLSVKVFSLVRNSHQSRAEALAHGLTYTAGVVISFLALAGLLLGLRAAGEQIGWGFQMQDPRFVFALGVLFFVFGLAMLGVFEVGTSLVGVDATVSHAGGLKASFGTGMLATLAATPCTGPMMASAVGFAASQSAWVAMGIFFFLGLGMAAPFLLLAAFPQAARWLPKPGAWMESLKQFLGFLLLGTTAWLTWVFAAQTDSNALLKMLLILVVLGLAGWIYGRWGSPYRPPRVKWAARAITTALVLGSLGIGFHAASQTQATPSASPVASTDPAAWIPYSEERLAELRRQGKPVFIDFTAKWCLICQANKISTLRTAEVEQAFARYGVTKMEADWTKRDPVITQALASFGRNGVPLYVLYGPNPNAQPQVLPVALTPGLVLEALEKMR